MEVFTFLLIVGLQIEVLILIVALFARSARPRKPKAPVFIDTSVLMDGRIVMTASTGFMPSNVVIPKSVLAELQLLADGSDSDKRARARHGLDVASQLRSAPTLATVFDDGNAESGVDDQLLKLAKKYKGSICTIDFNLNKVATVEGIPVLNINELAQNLRMNYLPGEKVSLSIIQKGNDAHQGVGYLADGTMVVVEQASSDINKQVEVEFIRSLQTAAGRMLFARKIGSLESKSKRTSGQKNSSPKGQRQTRHKKPEDSLIDLVNQQD